MKKKQTKNKPLADHYYRLHICIDHIFSLFLLIKMGFLKKKSSIWAKDEIVNDLNTE